MFRQIEEVNQYEARIVLEVQGDFESRMTSLSDENGQSFGGCVLHRDKTFRWKKVRHEYS